MPIVTGGLGLPEEGALVAAGLGVAEPAPPGAISAALTGGASITALLIANPTPPSRYGSGGGVIDRTPRPIVGVMAARITATAAVNAEITFSMDFDAEIEQLLLVGAI